MIPRRRYNVEKSFLKGVFSADAANVENFEKSLADFLGVSDSQIITTASGRGALALLLKTLNVPQGSTVMVPAYTLGAIGPFIESLGYHVINCDVAPDSPVMTPATVEEAWPSDADVRCVLPTHLFGLPADVPGIRAIANARGAVVIEDCAHSIGSTFDGRMTGTLGDGAFFSFNYLKPVNCFGGGAAVMSRSCHPVRFPDQKKLEIAAMFANGLFEDFVFAGPWLRIPTAMLVAPGISDVVTRIDSAVRRPSVQEFTCHSMAAAQAAHGLLSLASFPERLARRRLAALGICEAAGLDKTMWRDDNPYRPNAYFLTVRIPDAVVFRRRLWLHGIDAGVGTEVADYLDCPGAPERPRARAWFKETVQVPCNETLSDADIHTIGNTLKKLLRTGG